MHCLAHKDGELATSRAAANAGILMVLSPYATTSLEDVIAQGTGNPYMMQMCIVKDRNITMQLLRRAEGKWRKQSEGHELIFVLRLSFTRSFQSQEFLHVPLYSRRSILQDLHSSERVHLT
ncbi:uncharacterized protein M421DRAFT_240330 [Didymella exigua CBS 183.55]|uniref:FMN hydroxy acid dehydrogenase domain-containing protein n=1 Tax=Didymella exigua CBS 183.55 TaxID=1150837 RepID=A0A6A5RE62_9PLEO|nr:uncharacterized protein M421DRAFT_240330 [Didymella exigua CBS 183.55]KAF1925600.1 hypothetical protein M421DRAFT_240330 [Didymella exigua CBS 183.55]